MSLNIKHKKHCLTCQPLKSMMLKKQHKTEDSHVENTHCLTASGISS